MDGHLQNQIPLFLLILSWEDRHNEGLVSSSGCKIVNMALIFLYKLYKNGKQGWFWNFFSMQFGGDLVQSISASKRNYIATKNWHIILLKKTRVLVVSYSYFPTQYFDIHVKVKGRRDRKDGSFFSEMT